MICGIDPGKTGALCFYYSGVKEKYTFVEVHDMPVFDKELNAVALANLFKEFTPKHTYIESINSFGMGKQSAFNFGQGYGVIKGVLATLEIPYSLVTPSKWKRHFSLGRDKSASRQLATRLFPKNADDFKRAKDDGRAEAVLIAQWGRDNE